MSKISVAGLWELGWNTPITEVESWQLMLRDFGVDEFYMTPVSGIKGSKVIEMDTLEDILEANKDMTVVFVDERADTELSDFVHPKNVIYVFGPNNEHHIKCTGCNDIMWFGTNTLEPHVGLINKKQIKLN